MYRSIKFSIIFPTHLTGRYVLWTLDPVAVAGGGHVQKGRGPLSWCPCPVFPTSLALGKQGDWRQPDRGAPGHILDILLQGQAVDRVRD